MVKRVHERTKKMLSAFFAVISAFLLAGCAPGANLSAQAPVEVSANPGGVLRNGLEQFNLSCDELQARLEELPATPKTLPNPGTRSDFPHGSETGDPSIRLRNSTVCFYRAPIDPGGPKTNSDNQ